jgi:hypothetical protein
LTLDTQPAATVGIYSAADYIYSGLAMSPFWAFLVIVFSSPLAFAAIMVEVQPRDFVFYQPEQIHLSVSGSHGGCCIL